MLNTISHVDFPWNWFEEYTFKRSTPFPVLLVFHGPCTPWIDDSMLPPAWIMVSLHLSGGLNLFEIPKQASRGLEGPTIIASFQTPWMALSYGILLSQVGLNLLVIPEWASGGSEGCHALARRSRIVLISHKGKPLGWLVGWKCHVCRDALSMIWVIWWTVGGRVHRKSSSRKIMDQNTLLALGVLTLGVPMRSGFRPWTLAPFMSSRNCQKLTETRLEECCQDGLWHVVWFVFALTCTFQSTALQTGFLISYQQSTRS